MVKCDELIDSYLTWLKATIAVQELNGACKITTPFLDRHNDRLQIYIAPNRNGLRLTDDGYIISDLEMSGCPVDTKHRQTLLKTIIQGFGVHEQDGELYVEATSVNFAQKKHALLQAMVSVNDMFMTSKQRVRSLFFEDVTNFLDDHKVRFSENVAFTGKSGFPHKFDFLIPKSSESPERLLKAINHPTKEAATSSLFAWTDTRNARSQDSKFFVVINDSEKAVNNDVTSAFSEYDVEVIPWSEREQHIGELAA